MPVAQGLEALKTSFPLHLVFELDLAVLVRRLSGETTNRSKLMRTAVEAFLAAGGVAMVRNDPRFVPEVVFPQPRRPLNLYFPLETIGEIRRQCVDERAYGRYWRDSQVIAAALVWQAAGESGLPDSSFLLRALERAEREDEGLDQVMLRQLVDYALGA